MIIMRKYVIPLLIALGAGACRGELTEPKPADYVSNNVSSSLISTGASTKIMDEDKDGSADIIVDRENGLCFYAPGFENRCQDYYTEGRIEKYPLSGTARAYATNILQATSPLDFELAKIKFESEKAKAKK